MRKSIIAIIFLLSAAQMSAHDPDQISYHFMQMEDRAYLEVHLTPIGAFDLLKTLHSHINDSSVIRLADYRQSFEDYFNRTIGLDLGEGPVSFKLKDFNLVSHDAVLNFELSKFSGTFEEFNLELSAFTEIYRNTLNHVTISSPKYLEHFTLSASNQSYAVKELSRVDKGGLPLVLLSSVAALSLLYLMGRLSLSINQKLRW